jgi:transcriptional regulator with XRE-family HTH domain
MSNRDEQVGLTLSFLRGSMTQKALADAMKIRGWKWSQATVWSVEKGDRPLRLTEAVDVATILEVDVSEFLNDPVMASYSKEMADTLQGQVHAAREITASITKYLEHRERLHVLIQDAHARGIDTVEAWIAAATEAPSLDQAIEAGKDAFSGEYSEEA